VYANHHPLQQLSVGIFWNIALGLLST